MKFLKLVFGLLIAANVVTGQSTFKPDGGGLIQASMQPFLDLTQYGVKLNSPNDQSTAVQNLIDAGYKKFFLRTGDLYITSTLNFNDAKDIEIYGEGPGSRITGGTVLKQLLLFNGATKNLTLREFKVESRVVSTAEDALNLIYLYAAGATDTIDNIQLKHIYGKVPFAKTDFFKIVSQGTASMAQNVHAVIDADSIGRIAFEIQNHLGDAVIRYRDIHVTGNFKNIGTVTTGVKNVAVSFSGPGSDCSANDGYYQDIWEAPGFAYNIAIENAGCLRFHSNGNHFLTVNHGFVAIAGTTNGNLTDFWEIKDNIGYVRSHTDSNSARGIAINYVHNATIENNIFITQSYGYYLSNCSDNSIKHNFGKTLYEQVVANIDGTSTRNIFESNTFTDSGTVCCNAVIRFTGAGASGNRAPNNTLTQSDLTRGSVGSQSSATDNDDYIRQAGKVFGNYPGSTPEGNVVSEVGGIMTNNSGVIYSKTANSTANGWTVLPFASLTAPAFSTSISTPKIITTGSTPSVSNGGSTVIGSTGSAAVSGKDGAMLITVIVSGSGISAAGNVANITFATAYASAPKVVVANVAGTDVTFGWEVGNITTTGFSLRTPSTLTIGTYTVNAIVIQ